MLEEQLVTARKNKLLWRTDYGCNCISPRESCAMWAISMRQRRAFIHSSWLFNPQGFTKCQPSPLPNASSRSSLSTTFQKSTPMLSPEWGMFTFRECLTLTVAYFRINTVKYLLCSLTHTIGNCHIFIASGFLSVFYYMPKQPYWLALAVIFNHPPAGCQAVFDPTSHHEGGDPDCLNNPSLPPCRCLKASGFSKLECVWPRVISLWGTVNMSSLECPSSSVRCRCWQIREVYALSL